MTANAVPSPADTSAPVLQWVRTRPPAGTSGSPCRGHRRAGRGFLSGDGPGRGQGRVGALAFGIGAAVRWPGGLVGSERTAGAPGQVHRGRPGRGERARPRPPRPRPGTRPAPRRTRRPRPSAGRAADHQAADGVDQFGDGCAQVTTAPRPAAGSGRAARWRALRRRRASAAWACPCAESASGRGRRSTAGPPAAGARAAFCCLASCPACFVRVWAPAGTGGPAQAASSPAAKRRAGPARQQRREGEP